MAVEVEESPPHPAASSVHLQCCKYCFPCVQGLAKIENGDESDFPFPSSLGDQLLGGSVASGSSGAPQQNIEPGGRIGVSASAGLASLDLSQFRFKWLISSVFWKCCPCREPGIGGLSPVAMERWMWIRCGCHSPCWQHLFLKTVFSSAQLHPKIFPSKQILLF